MLNEGLELMAVGMTTVFGFLMLLVGLMQISGAYFQRRPPEASAEAALGPQTASAQIGAEVAAAIAAAYEYRRRGGTGS